MTKKYIQDFKSKLSNGGKVSPEELQDFFSRLEGDLKDKKYGLVWESQTEQVIEQLKTNKVYLEEEQDLKITQDPDNPKSNILIEGDNYEALTYLKEINQKVDVIYIDPPYNTGNKDFIYNDRFIDKEDGFRHSQWLSFMDARLRLARELMTDDGVIFISIDDNEQSQLKLLCDSVLGERNFVTNMIWKSRSSLQYSEPLISSQTEYVLVYVKDRKKWNVKTNKFNRIKKVYDSGNYKNPDNDPNGPWLSSGIIRDDGRRKYTIISPTGVSHTEAWLYTEENFLTLVNEGRIWWGNKGDSKPRKKSYLKDFEGNVSTNILMDEFSLSTKDDGTYSKKKVFTIGTTESGTKDLISILGSKIFDYPKPKSLIQYLINLHPSKKATVLDFFAGSGTTGHAVLELNKEDGGNRQFILCTNNENNIAEEVTYERLKRVMNGYTTPKGKDVSGIPTNLAYYRTKQVSKYDIAFEEVVLQHIIPVIQFTEGVYSRTQPSPHITQLGDSIFIFNQYMVEDDEIDTLVGLVKDGDILYIQEGQVDYIKTKLPDGVVYKYLEDVLPTNR